MLSGAKNIMFVSLRLFIVIIFLVNISYANQQVNASKLGHEIQQIINRVDPNVNIGMAIQTMKSNKILFQRHAQRLYVPASNLKLLPATASLLLLGPDFHFDTTIAVKPHTVHHHTISGDLYIRFTGDPNLTMHDLNIMIKKLASRGIRDIKGNVYIDNSVYDNKGFGHGWMWDELNFEYAAPINAININHNSFYIKLIPAKHVGKLTRIKSLNSLKFTPIKNQVKTVANNVQCDLDLDVNNQNHYLLTGCMHINANPKRLAFAVKNIELYSKELINDLLKQHHIHVTGKITKGIAHSKVTMLVEHRSKSLTILLNQMLKESDNLIADSLLKNLGLRFYHQQGTWKNGVKAMKKILDRSIRINFNKDVIVDGAGLSRYNLITPQQISKILTFAYHNFAIAPELIAALPIAGTDGTLHSRLTDFANKNVIRAKTGTMSSVSTLSGYIQTKRHHILAFSIMINGFSSKAKKYQQLEDQIIRLLYRVG